VRGSVFCDGACRGNGTRRAVAGWAWAYWPGVARGEPTASGSAGLPPPATNQRAELMALLEALRWIQAQGSHIDPVTIYTDSQYTIKCTTVWGPSWKKKGWRRDSGEPLQNLDIIKPLVDLWGTMRVPLVHVRGHQTGATPEAWGNNWVDRAAVAAAGGSGPDDCGGGGGGGLGLTMFTEAALSATADAIEHLVDARGRASSSSVSSCSSLSSPRPAPVLSPAPPVFAVRKTAATSTVVKQMDIRNWFGGGGGKA
jgi:ribonuclease HI